MLKPFDEALSELIVKYLDLEIPKEDIMEALLLEHKLLENDEDIMETCLLEHRSLDDEL